MNLFDLIADEIRRHGPISFSRYMDLALYHPTMGFYSRGGAGRRRDFITSPEVGPLFGAVVARALDGWWEEFGCPDRFTFVDAGAGPGTLARSILKAEPRCLEALDYVAVEISEAQRDRHPTGIRPMAAMPEAVDVGVIFANELLDNLPFDVLAFVADRGWCEVRVGVDRGSLVEVMIDVDASLDLADPGPADNRMPVQRRAGEWVSSALSSLSRGRLVVVDYGVSRYPVDAGREWLRTYSEHGPGGDALELPGEKDITADVDIETVTRDQQPESVRSQADWLASHGLEAMVEEGNAYWAAHAAAPDLAAMVMRSRSGEGRALVDPAGLGNFKVIEWCVGTD